MTKRIPLVLAAAALAASFAATSPANADHTLCDNEGDQTEVWAGEVEGRGAGVDSDPSTTYVCVYTGLTGTGYQLVVIRTNGGQQTVCTFYGGGTNSCRYIP